MAGLCPGRDHGIGRGVPLMTRSEWLDTATARVRFSRDRERVRRELEDHLNDRIDAAREQGMDYPEASAAAVEAMGDPEPLAVELGKVHSPWLGRLWVLSRVLAVFALLVLVLAFLSGNLWSPLRTTLLGYGVWELEVPPEVEDINGRTITRTGLWEDMDLGEQGGYHWRVPLAFTQYSANQDTGGDGIYSMELHLTAETARFWEPWADSETVLAVEDNTGCQYSSWLPAGGTEAAPYFYANGSSDGLGKSHATVYIYFMPDNRDLKWLDLTIGDTVLRVDLEGGVRP